MSDGHDPAPRAGEADYVTLRPGQPVGRYRIVSVLGEGGFGITYRAADTELGREVALKEYLPASLAVRQDGVTVVPRSQASAQDFAWGRDRFMAEGRTLAALHRAPGIVLVHDYLEANGTAYLVMELVAGETLQARIDRGGRLDAAVVGRILSTLLDGLQDVHDAGFLHRDIKPANILLDADGHPTLIDFGAARAAMAGRSTSLTAIFTPGYAAAEQMTSARQGPWTDIYGLSATLYCAITGTVPPTAFDRMLEDSCVPLVRRKPPGFGRELLAGLDAGLAVRADERPQSIAAWRPMLRLEGPRDATVVMAQGKAARPAVAARPASRRPAGPASRRRLVAWLGGGAAILVLVAGALLVAGAERRAVPDAERRAVPDAERRAVPESRAAAPVDGAAEQVRLAAEAQHLKDQEELVRLRAEAAARDKADQDAAQRRQIEGETRRKIEAEIAEAQRQQEAARQKAEADAAAEARRQADAKALAAQKQAEQEAASKAEAEAAAQKSDADRRNAEAAEAALGLTPADRQRLQLALAGAGFPPGASDGVLGPRSREMIAAWQRKTGRAATGYLSAEAHRELLRQAPALPEPLPVGTGTMPPTPEPPAKANGQCEGSFTAQMCRAAYQGFPSNCWRVAVTIRNGTLSGGWTSSSSGEAQTLTGTIGAGGDVQISYSGVGQQTHVNQRFVVVLSGRVADGAISASGRAGSTGRDFSIRMPCR